MSSTERHRGIQIHRGIIYGSHARLLTPEEKATAPPEHTHKWTIFISSATSPPPPPGSLDEVDMNLIPGGADDLGYLFKRVTFKLHDTYHNPNRVVEKAPFQVTETGWGEFTVNARINFVPESGEKPMNIGIPIKLFHRGQPVEPAPVEDGATAGQSGGEATKEASTAAGTADSADKVRDEKADEDVTMGGPAAATADAEASGPVSSEVSPLPVDSDTVKAESGVDPDGDAEGDTQTPGTNTNTNADTPAATAAAGAAEEDGSISAAAPAGATAEPSAPPAPTPAQQAHSAKMASKYPVHGWQYDELVFCDPYPAFYQILTQNTPTSLPPQNRRAKDLREEYERRDPAAGEGERAKKRRTGGGRASVGAGALSREGTAAADGDDTKDKPVPPPAEDATADTPLEFSKEMEKGEWNVLNDARIKVVEEMDRWREKLIAQEKELFRIKEEMKTMS